MKNLRKYGDMFGKIAKRMREDFKNMSVEELQKIAREARSVNERNCAWTEFRIAKTVLECALDEIREKQRRMIIWEN